jgi:hypothetical protein
MASLCGHNCCYGALNYFFGILGSNASRKVNSSISYYCAFREVCGCCTVGSITKFVVIPHGIERIWHSDIFGNSRYRWISVAYSVYEWAGGTHILADFFCFFSHMLQNLCFCFSSVEYSNVMLCSSTSSVSGCGSVRVNQVTWVYEVTHLSDMLYRVYFVFLLDLRELARSSVSVASMLRLWRLDNWWSVRSIALMITLRMYNKNTTCAVADGWKMLTSWRNAPSTTAVDVDYSVEFLTEWDQPHSRTNVNALLHWYSRTYR